MQRVPGCVHLCHRVRAGLGERWMAVASYVRRALQPQLPALLSRFSSLDVRYRGVCIVPLLVAAAPFDLLRNHGHLTAGQQPASAGAVAAAVTAASAAGDSMGWLMVDEWMGLRALVRDYFLPLVGGGGGSAGGPTFVLELGYEAAVATLGVARALDEEDWAASAVRLAPREGKRSWSIAKSRALANAAVRCCRS
eukprot:SAG22_NODE_807_length_7081_cov_2.460756_10_plen_195_part_00